MGWVSPTGHSDPDNKWVDEENAYDGDISGYSYALNYWIDKGYYLELLHDAIVCDKIRVYTEGGAYHANAHVSIDVFYEDDWHNIHTGSIPRLEWVSINIGVPPKAINKARIKNTAPNGIGAVHLFELDFWEIVTPTAPTVTTQPVSTIRDIDAAGHSTITDGGGEGCSERGVCWNTTGNPTTADSKSAETNSFGVGEFTRLMTGLTPGQKYYVKGYAINSIGTGYGGEVSFTTKPSAPSSLTATTISETQINLAWTKGAGAVNTVIRRKVNSAPASIIDGVEVYNGPGTSHNDTTCDPGVHYYYRAWSYHTTSGYSVGYDTADSSTVIMPTGTTEAATLIGDVNATLNGEVTDDGGEPCEVRFQYGTTAAYGTNTAWQTGKVTDDIFSQRITGLTPLTGYHFRAQIKNSAGTANGADATFTTISFPTPFLRRVLRDTFGGGADISDANPLEVHDPSAEPIAVGHLQMAATTIELNQAVGDKDLFLGTDQDVVVEKLVIRIPVDVSGGAMTSLSIQTDDTTNQVFIDATTGAKANLTAQSQLAWTGAVLLKATKKIQLTIAGAATGIDCSCDVVAECRAVVAGGYLG